MSTQKISMCMTAAVLLVAGSAAHAADAVPTALQPPAGYAVAFTAKAAGVQIYTSTAEAGATPKWTFDAPLAELTTTAAVIHHYAGPSWEAVDGSKITRDTNTPVVTVPATQPSRDIPWLLIKVVADPAAGALSKVGYVQRISTQGGVAPSTPPVRSGTKVGVPYTATYVFYAKSN